MHCCENTCLADESLSPSSSFRGLFASHYTETHYALDGSVVTSAVHNQSVSHVQRKLNVSCLVCCVLVWFCWRRPSKHTWCTDSQLNQTVIYSWSTNHADCLIMYLRAKRQFGHGWDFCPCDLLDGKLWVYFAWFLFLFYFFLLKPIWPLGFDDGILSSLADLSPNSPLSK